MNPIFEHALKVRDYECDTQGHVNNANYQHYFEVTRHEFLEKVGLNFHELHLQGIDAVVSRVEIRYTRLERVGVKYIFRQEIIRERDEIVCAKAKIEVVNLVSGRLSQPVLFDQAFRDYIG